MLRREKLEKKSRSFLKSTSLTEPRIKAVEMAYARFDRPVFLQRKHFIEEVTGLDDVFDVLEEWPEDRRGLSFEILEDACRRAASGRFPVEAVRENFRRFIKKAGMLAEVEDVPNFARVLNDRNIGGI